MLKDVTLGRFYDNDSFLRHLDPRTKLAGLVIAIIGIFLCSSIVSCLFTLICVTALIYLSKVPLRHIFRGLGSLFILLAVVAALNIILVPDGLFRAALICLRVIEVILVSNLLCLSTRPRAIANGLETSLSWMKRFRVPVHDFAMIVSIALSFVPLLADEANRIRDAQISRGADYSKGSVIKRAKASVSIIVPVFVSALARSEDLAVAMDCRLYGCSSEPSRLHPLEYSYEDAAAYICILTYLCVVILMKVGQL